VSIKDVDQTKITDLEGFIMPIGKEIGSFSLNSTSLRIGVDAGGNNTVTITLEGEVSGGWSGTVLSTMDVTMADLNESGSYVSNVAVYLNDGGIVTGSGTGIIAAIGNHKWRLNGVDVISDGSRIAMEAEIELATRKMTGKIFEIT